MNEFISLLFAATVMVLLALAIRNMLFPFFGVLFGWGGYSSTRQTQVVQTTQETNHIRSTNSHNKITVHRHTHIHVHRPKSSTRQLLQQPVVVIPATTRRAAPQGDNRQRQFRPTATYRLPANQRLLLPAPKGKGH